MTVLLAADGFLNVVVLLEIDERLHTISLRESWYETVAVFAHAPIEVAGDADIERAIAFAREDIDEVSVFSLHDANLSVIPGARGSPSGHPGPSIRAAGGS